ncbi:MAG: AMP-binding protein, partial [Propionibacteriaceae bacterium]|nr:AMP-binding protein [Propionibacteriaceae bacterium]
MPSAVSGQSAVSVFLTRLAEGGDRPAITDPSGLTVTYSMLDLGARRLCSALRAQGVDRGHTVALITQRGVDFYCGLLGILYAGAAYVPLDPDDPPERTAALIARAEPIAVVVDDWALAERTGVLPVVCLVDPALGRRPADGPHPLSPDDLAVCLFVGKSPREAVPFALDHRALVRSAEAAQSVLGLTPEDKILAHAGPAAPESVWEWTQTLLTGASARTAPAEATRDLDQLRACLADDVTAATLPAFAAALVEPTQLRALATLGAVGAPIPGFAGALVHLADVKDVPALGWPQPGLAAEVEELLNAWPGIDEAAVVEAAPGQPVNAYFTSRAAVDPLLVLDTVAEKLPPAARPGQLVLVDVIARTATGEPDVRALPGPGATPPELGAAEADVQAAFANVLGLESVASDDNFYALGGGGAAALAVREALSRRGWRVTEADLAAHRTPRALAAHATRVAGPAARPSGATGPLDLTPGQARRLAEGLPELRHFGRAVAIGSPTPFDLGSLREAFAAVTAFHDGLRVTLADGFQALQPVEAAVPVPLDVTVLESSPDDLAEVAAEATALQSALDPDHGPLLAAHVWRLDGCDRLVLAAHRLAVDTRSFHLVVQDVV